MFGRNPRKAREMEQQIRNRQVMLLSSLPCVLIAHFSLPVAVFVALKSLSGLVVVLCFFPSLFIISSLFSVFNVPICLAFLFLSLPLSLSL